MSIAVRDYLHNKKMVGCRLLKLGELYFAETFEENLSIGQKVIIDIPQKGLYVASVANKILNFYNQDNFKKKNNIVKIKRILTKEDFEEIEKNKTKVLEARAIINKNIEELELKMNIVDVECTFDFSKIIFYFTADGRVDFRKLILTMAKILKIRIEMRQIGVRDEAKRLGGIGICGKPFCCSTFLDKFNPVSARMAKEQSMLNPSKISGLCGRFMCCLQYEQNSYKEMLKVMPSINSRVDTPEGSGVVIEVLTLKNKVKIKFDKEEGDLVKCFDVADVSLIDS